jgi:3-oxoacyl-[acyl-carrier-protein] synthase II
VTRVVVTGLGVVSPYGLGVAPFWEGLAAGRPVIGPISLFETDGFRSRIAGEVPAEAVAALPASRRRSRADRFALAAAREAVRDAGLSRSDRAAGGVIVGGVGGGMLEVETWYWERARSGEDPRRRESLRSVLPASHAEAVAHRLGLAGPKETVVMACSSGAAALALAADLIRGGVAPLMLAGGVDALTRICFMGFNALKLLDPDPCRPFDRGRRGMSLGEGAAFLVLEDEAHARARGARPYGELLSWAGTTDAFHITSPHPAAEGTIRAIELALSGAGLEPGEVEYVNAHGTGTLQNDRTEALALTKVFGAGTVLVSASKSLFGHAMAAAGALEAVATLLSVRHGLIPPTAHLDDPDPDIPFDCVPHRARPAPLTVAISNSFGFGGQNVVLVFRRWAG